MGAEPIPGGGVHFRVWAPKCRRVEVQVEGRAGAAPRAVGLDREEGGYFGGFVAEAGPGTLYRYRLDGDEAYPDPASRWQPEGPHGPSGVIDPTAYRWGDGDWKGVALPGQVLYEMHVGTFTPEGTWDAAAKDLPRLKEMGITTIELMPAAEIPGRFGWGYDGVDLFAPYHVYGEPDAMRRFVDRAHALGLGVILDVVYNHLGPEGNYLGLFSDHYVSDRHKTEWGPALNYDGPQSGSVREFILSGTARWIAEYHLDGLRIDATQSFFDESDDHILAAITRATREAAGGRSVLVVAENEPEHACLVRPPEEDGHGLDAVWNEDFHHVAIALATGRRESYHGDYQGSAQEVVSLFKRGFLYQGQRNARQGKRRGTPTAGVPPARFVNYLQNHDQVANSLRGSRLSHLADPASLRAITAVFLLAPGTPMLFQGQEYAATTPFFYFGDLEESVRDAMREGRAEFLGQFPSIATPEAKALLADPFDPETFRRSKLDPDEPRRRPEACALHRDLLRLRREDPVIRAQQPGGLDGAVLGPGAFVVRYFGAEPGGGGDRLLVANLGPDLDYRPASEPLLAEPAGRSWRVLWSSEDPNYGGGGTPHPVGPDGWRLLGRSALVLVDRPGEEPEG